MRAVLYARYSTAKQRVESIDDQLRECRERASREGFNVVTTFSDAAISGGTTQRPGYQRMLAVARRSEFDVIVAEDSSRLWRNMAEQAPRLAELHDLGIHVVAGGLDTRQKGSGMMSAVAGAMSAQYREDIGEKSRRGNKGNALARKPTGGRAYGYRSLSRPDGSRYIETVPEQADVVRRIFTAYAAGDSPKTIAAALNADGLASPGATWARKERRTDSRWMGNAISGDPEKGIGILCNARYVGRVRWARTQWKRSALDSARRRVIHLDEAEVEYQDESLRIVPQELWERVQQRRLATHAERKGKGPGGGHARHMLTGVLRCAECGGKYTIISKTSYGCATNVNGGDAACPNRKRVPRAKIEGAVVTLMTEEVLTPKTLNDVMRTARQMHAAQRVNAGAEEKALAARRRELEAKVANLTDAIASGALRSSPALAAALSGAEAELASLAPLPKAQIIDLVPKLEVKLRSMLREMAMALGKNPERSREILKRLFGEIRLLRTPDGGLVARLEMHPRHLLELRGAVDCASGSGGRI